MVDGIELSKKDKQRIIKFLMIVGTVSLLINWAFIFLVVRMGWIEFIIAESIFILGLFIGYRQNLRE